MTLGGEKAMEVIGAVVAMDSSSVSYAICTVCERTLAPTISTNCNDAAAAPPFCKFCEDRKAAAASSSYINPLAFATPLSSSFRSKRLYRLLLSVAIENKVTVVICFDKAARVLFGCSADEFFDFAKLNPFAELNAGKILEGEMFQMRLSKPKNGNAQHLRVASIVPLRSDFCPVINTLKKLYKVGPSSHQVGNSH